jgi:hypothetical protein
MAMLIANHSQLLPLNNLEKVALDLQIYILDMDNKLAIYKVIIEVQNEYKSWIYNPYRVRVGDIGELKDKVGRASSPFDVLQSLVMFFQKGAWKTTSANTLLMAKLSKKLVQYDWNCERRSSLWVDPHISQRLCSLFLNYAHLAVIKKSLASEEEMVTLQEKLKKEREEEVKRLPPENIKKRKEQIGGQLKNTERFKAYKITEVKQLSDDPNYNKKAALISSSLRALNSHLFKRSKLTPSPKKLSENEVFCDRLHFLERFFKSLENEQIVEQKGEESPLRQRK